jgi:hypothetical protein
MNLTKSALAKELFDITSFAQSRGWCAEELLSAETKKQERKFRRQEKQLAAAKSRGADEK